MIHSVGKGPEKRVLEVSDIAMLARRRPPRGTIGNGAQDGGTLYFIKQQQWSGRCSAAQEGMRIVSREDSR